jgi:hypothetical protein
VRVWGTDAGNAIPFVPMERAIFDSGPPKLLCLGAGPDGLVVVRQTRDHLEDLDGFLVPWEQVRDVERDPHLVRDVLTVEIAGRSPLRVAVSNHLLLTGNRSAAKALSDWAHRPPPVAPPEVPSPWHPEEHGIAT